MRYVVRTPFGLALQGVRDEPVRMRALGFNIGLHRTLAFGFAAFIAAIAGIFSVWCNTQISPASIDLGATNDVLDRGGDRRALPARGRVDRRVHLRRAGQLRRRRIGFIGPRFNTVIGIVFLVIVLVSPGGLMGIWERLRRRSRSSRRRGRRHAPDRHDTGERRLVTRIGVHNG